MRKPNGVQSVNPSGEYRWWRVFLICHMIPSLCEGDQHQDPSDSGGWVHRDPEWHWHCLPALDRQTRDHAATGLQTPPTLICSQNRRTDLFVSMQWLHVTLSLYLSGHGEHNVIISSRAQASGPLPRYCLVLFGIQVQKKKKEKMLLCIVDEICIFFPQLEDLQNCGDLQISLRQSKSGETHSTANSTKNLFFIYTKTFPCSDIV